MKWTEPIVLIKVALLWHFTLAQIPEALETLGIAPSDLHGVEPFTNRTIDQAILIALGGIDVAANKIIGPGGKILAELDMMLSRDQFLKMYEPPSSDMRTAPIMGRQKRKAIRDHILRWPNAKVPYRIAQNHFSAEEIYHIKRAMTEWEKYTCVRFHKAKPSDRNLVRFKNGDGCNSQLGMVGGVQELNLDSNGCRYKGLYLHEIGHAIGLVHEHQLPTRDRFIEVLYNNVEPSMKIWFNKYAASEINQYSVPYEYSSVMHYGITAFSKDGKSRTMKAKDPSKEKSIGNVWRKELAFTDVKTVNIMYQCTDHCPSTVKCSGGGFVDQNCQCICPEGNDNCRDGEPDNEDDEGCRDEHDTSWQCNVWAKQGECERNPKFMHHACRKACGMCGEQDDGLDGNHVTSWAWQWLGMFTNMLPKNWTTGVCNDFFPAEKCSAWSANGDCVVNTKWMEKYCKKTCRGCVADLLGDKPETDCTNIHPDDEECDQWAITGECRVNTKWMNKNCRKSCKSCDNENPTSPDEEEEETEDDFLQDDGACIDIHDTIECATWAEKGECGSNPTWMLPNCRESCNKCKTGICSNLYNDDKCIKWANSKECSKNPTWMASNCQKACGKCGGDTGDDTDAEKEESSETETNDEEESREEYYEYNYDENNDDYEDTGDCRNEHDNAECRTWASNDHCTVNPEWMLDHCKKACGVCDDNNDDKSDRNDDNENEDEPEVDVDTPNEDGCYDSNNNCVTWAEHGTCESNPSYALKNCKKSCDNCNGCRDKHILCQVWAKGGQCARNVGYMLRFCQKSCNVCSV